MFLRIMCALAAFLVLFPAATVLGQDVKLEAGEIPTPEDVSPAMQEVVGKTSYSVTVDGEVTAHFWFLGDPLMSDNPSTELGVAFGQLPQGGLLGVVQLVKPWSDYKNNSIQEGTYTLRYAVMPADGNHMGVAPYRDFLLLSSAAGDPDPTKNLNFVELLMSSNEASGVPHPAVLALFPIWDEISEPTLTKNEMDQWTIAVKLGDQVFGFVILGHGEA